MLSVLNLLSHSLVNETVAPKSKNKRTHVDYLQNVTSKTRGAGFCRAENIIPDTLKGEG